MADLNGDNSAQDVTINDPSTGISANVITEAGINKLQVKATSVPQPLGNLVFLHAENNGSNDMAVNGSSTPVDFIVPANANFDIVCESLAFESFASGIKIDKFLSLNSALSTGLIIEVKSEDTIFQFLPITDTQEFDSHFAYGPGRSFDLLFASGNDSMVARFGPSTPFIIKQQGTYSNDDYIKVTVADNLSQISSLQFLIFGALNI